MSRNSFLFIAGAFAFLILLASGFGQSFPDIKPSPQQVEWQDLEFGVIIHFGTNTFLDREWGDGKADPKVFNPAQLDAEQWMRAIKASGAKYVVLVAKHHDGFCLWPTEQTDYSVKSSPWLGGKGDLVRLVSDAARKYGLKFGVYLSPWDRHEPRYANSADYDNYYAAQLDELVQHYGNLRNSGSTAPAAVGMFTTFHASSTNFASINPMLWSSRMWRCLSMEISDG